MEVERSETLHKTWPKIWVPKPPNLKINKVFNSDVLRKTELTLWWLADHRQYTEESLRSMELQNANQCVFRKVLT